MKTKISIVPVGKEHRLRETRGGKVINHRYNTRRGALKSVLAWIQAYRQGQFEFTGLTAAEQKRVRAVFGQAHCP